MKNNLYYITFLLGLVGGISLSAANITVENYVSEPVTVLVEYGVSALCKFDLFYLSSVGSSGSAKTIAAKACCIKSVKVNSEDEKRFFTFKPTLPLCLSNRRFVINYAQPRSKNFVVKLQ